MAAGFAYGSTTLYNSSVRPRSTRINVRIYRATRTNGGLVGGRECRTLREISCGLLYGLNDGKYRSETGKREDREIE